MGYEPLPLGYARNSMGYERFPLGYEPLPLGYARNSMSYERFPLGYERTASSSQV